MQRLKLLLLLCIISSFDLVKLYYSFSEKATKGCFIKVLILNRMDYEGFCLSYYYDILLQYMTTVIFLLFCSISFKGDLKSNKMFQIQIKVWN